MFFYSCSMLDIYLVMWYLLLQWNTERCVLWLIGEQKQLYYTIFNFSFNKIHSMYMLFHFQCMNWLFEQILFEFYSVEMKRKCSVLSKRKMLIFAQLFVERKKWWKKIVNNILWKRKMIFFSKALTIHTFKVDMETLWFQFAAIFPMPLECELTSCKWVNPSDIDSQMNKKNWEPQTSCVFL